jgi:hypothetical protein
VGGCGVKSRSHSCSLSSAGGGSSGSRASSPGARNASCAWIVSVGVSPGLIAVCDDPAVAIIGTGPVPARCLGAGCLFVAALCALGSPARNAFGVTAAVHTGCYEIGQVSFSPGLRTMTPPGQATTETVTGKLSECAGGGVTGGTFRGLFKSKNQSCASGRASGTVKITWNTGKTSLESLTITTTSLATTSIVGSVTAGVFAGDGLKSGRTLEPVKGVCTSSQPATVVSFSDTAEI